MNLEEQLRVLIELAPPHIQRHFACDCAERALLRTGVENEASWNAIEVSRRFTEGEATVDELSAAFNAALDAARDAAWVAARVAAFNAAWAAACAAARVAAQDAAFNAARVAARIAAFNAAWAAAQDKEREWQIAHLQSLIAIHNATRSSLLHILQQRAEALRPTFTQYARTLEERAFE